MRRRIITSFIVLLIIGIVLNVLVAWTCAAAFKRRFFDAGGLGRLRAAEYAEQDRLAQAGEMAFGRPYYAGLFVTFGTRVLQIKSAPNQRGWREQQAAGWPMLALSADRIVDVNREPEIRNGARLGRMELQFSVLHGALGTAVLRSTPAPPAGPPMPPAAAPGGGGVWADHLLPLRPMWPGFAINSIFFALAAGTAWMLWVLPMRLQRGLRGLCARCAYPMGVSPVCTECGRKVRVRPVAGR
jgi:hypothetical protein